MRPLQRPPRPIPIPADYKIYLEPLRQAFGSYCGYCERPDKLDVEHVIPKSKVPALEVDWDNLLLGCPRCNRDFKKSRNDDRTGYLWPDQHDTFHALEYLPDGRVKPVAGAFQHDAAQLIDLVKLEDAAHQATLNLGRQRMFRLAQRMLEHYQNGHTTIADVIDVARLGYWSVWLTVFANEALVVTALTDPNNFPGTHRAYFPA